MTQILARVGTQSSINLISMSNESFPNTSTPLRKYFEKKITRSRSETVTNFPGLNKIWTCVASHVLGYRKHWHSHGATCHRVQNPIQNFLPLLVHGLCTACGLVAGIPTNKIVCIVARNAGPQYQ